MTNSLVVGAGGFVGAIARFIVSSWIGRQWGWSFPLGTFAVNVSGCFLIGLLMSLLSDRFMVDPRWRLFLAIGFLGGYTTFSTFAYETGRLLQENGWMLAAINVVLSVFAGFAALKTGEVMARVV